MRVYDPRVGKFLSVDPLSMDFPWYTPYQFAGNKPIWAIDLDGAEEILFSANEIFETGTDIGAGSGARVAPAGWLSELSTIETASEVSTFEGAGLGQTLGNVKVGPSGMWQELPFNWTSFDITPVIPKPQNYVRGKGPLLNAPNQSTGAQQAPQQANKPAANPQRQFDPKQSPTKEDDDKSDLIYRGGANTDVVFTPALKDAKFYDPKGGLSTFNNPEEAAKEGGKVQILSRKTLKALGFTLTDVGSHVGIKPKSERALTAWAETKDDLRAGKRSAHLLTKFVQKARVGEVKVPKPPKK